MAPRLWGLVRGRLPHAMAEERGEREGGGNNERGSGARPGAVPLPYAQIGMLSKDVLYGARSRGMYVLDHKVAFSTRTASGITLSGTALRAGDTISTTTAATLALGGKTEDGRTTTPVLLTASAASSGAVELDLTAPVTPALKATLLTSMAPPTAATTTTAPPLNASLGLEYVGSTTAPVHIKGSTTLEPSPLLTLSLGSASGRVRLGGDLAFSAARASVAARDAAAAAAQLRAEVGGTPVGADTSPTSTPIAPATTSPSRTKSGPKVSPPPASSAPELTTPTPPLASASAPPTAASSKGAAVKVAPDVGTARLTGALLGGVTRWSVGGAWVNEAHELSAFLSDAANGSSGVGRSLGVRLGWAYRSGPHTTLGAEVTQDVRTLQGLLSGKAPASGPPPRVALGLATRVPPLSDGSGTKDGTEGVTDAWGTAKLKLDSAGVVSALYMDRVPLARGGPGDPALQITWAAQLNVLGPSGYLPRLGMTVELV